MFAHKRGAFGKNFLAVCKKNFILVYKKNYYRTKKSFILVYKKITDV